MNSMLETVFGLLGGLALFLFGMNMMSEGLQKAAGERMKSILSMLTKNPVLGVLAGALVTAVLQSSSATTVMVIGFVSAGLMNLPQAISVIFGANIGTTMTAQLMAFKISDYIWPIVFIGFIIQFLAKNEKIKNVGQTIFAFGLLFVGIETMGSVMKPLASSPVFTELIAKVSHIPVLGVLVGAGMTLIVQSSSATIAVLQNFASQPGPDGISSVIGLVGAIPILFGDNIGTTITALLASIGQSKNAKRTAIAHSIFNITGSLVFIWFIPWFAKFVEWISPKGPELEVISRQIANAHTTFNIVCTLLWLPFIGILVKIVTAIIRGEDEVEEKATFKYLDYNLIGQPVFAIKMITEQLEIICEKVGTLLPDLKQSIHKNDAFTLNEVMHTCANIKEISEELMHYMATMFSAGSLTEDQATSAADIMIVMENVEHIGMRCNEISDFVKKKIDRGYQYSEAALEEMQVNINLVSGLYESVMRYLRKEESFTPEQLNERRNEIIKKRNEARKNNSQRLKENYCEKENGELFNQTLFCLERISNDCFNLLENGIQHFYLQSTLQDKE